MTRHLFEAEIEGIKKRIQDIILNKPTIEMDSNSNSEEENEIDINKFIINNKPKQTESTKQTEPTKQTESTKQMSKSESKFGDYDLHIFQSIVSKHLFERNKKKPPSIVEREKRMRERTHVYSSFKEMNKVANESHIRWMKLSDTTKKTHIKTYMNDRFKKTYSKTKFETDNIKKELKDTISTIFKRMEEGEFDEPGTLIYDYSKRKIVNIK